MSEESRGMHGYSGMIFFLLLTYLFTCEGTVEPLRELPLRVAPCSHLVDSRAHFPLGAAYLGCSSSLNAFQNFLCTSILFTSLGIWFQLWVTRKLKKNFSHIPPAMLHSDVQWVWSCSHCSHFLSGHFEPGFYLQITLAMKYFMFLFDMFLSVIMVPVLYTCQYSVVSLDFSLCNEGNHT